MADRTAWRICRGYGWWSNFGKKRGKNGKRPGPPVHDDHCAVRVEKGRIRHEFTADGPNRLWLTDITEHWSSVQQTRSMVGVRTIWWTLGDLNP
jgi:putative transposase